MPEERIEELLEQRDFKQLKLELEDMYPVDLAEIMEELTDKQVVLIFRLLPKEEAAETFSYMNAEMRQVLIDALTDSELQEVMEEMYIDDTVDVLEEMPANVVDRLLLVTDEETRKQINMLLQRWKYHECRVHRFEKRDDGGRSNFKNQAGRNQ